MTKIVTEAEAQTRQPKGFRRGGTRTKDGRTGYRFLYAMVREAARRGWGQMLEVKPLARFLLRPRGYGGQAARTGNKYPYHPPMKKRDTGLVTVVE